MMGIGRATAPEMWPGREVRSEDCRIYTTENVYPNVHIAAFLQGVDCTKKDGQKYISRFYIV